MQPDQKFEIGKAIELTDGHGRHDHRHGPAGRRGDSRGGDAGSRGHLGARASICTRSSRSTAKRLRSAAAETGAIVVAEEHLVDGGLGVRVAQVVAETHPCVMEFVGIENTYAESGTPGAAARKIRPDVDKIAEAVRRVNFAQALRWTREGAVCRAAPSLT